MMMNKFYILEYKMQKKVKCKEKLSEKIRINMREYKVVTVERLIGTRLSTFFS